MSISLQFLGAARHVTGSRHLLRVNDKAFLLDCGLVQGPRRIADAANRELGIPVADIDAVVLSHAHIDHSGALPRLVRLGFEGPIHCTHATADLTRLLLFDSAGIQASDAKFLESRGQVFEPWYDDDDVKKTLRQVRGHAYHETFEVAPELRVEFLDAGHILGAAMVVAHVDDGSRQLRIAFTGDHGRKELPILRDPERLPPCDVLITESTYGDREHPPNADLEQTLGDIVREELADGGRILIPAFSVGRTQRVLYFLGKLIQRGELPRLPVFVDSPLATEATKVMAQHTECYDEEARAVLASGHSPFYFSGVRYVADVEESKQLNHVRSPCVIVAASGMMEAGRILHHLRVSLHRRQDCVLVVGFQAANTLGRRLVDGDPEVKVFGEMHRVRCRVREMAGFSAHADHVELLANTRHLAADCRRTFVVHGEEHAALAYADELHDAGFRGIEVPTKGQEFEL